MTALAAYFVLLIIAILSTIPPIAISVMNALFSRLRPFWAIICACALAVAITPDAAAASRRASKRAFTLVLDAGHGGKDAGCVGRLTNEKSITLDVARRVADIVRRECPKVNVLLTRDDDRYLTLQRRADIANDAGGDLFVSIHVNSVDARSRGRESVKGTSVYALGAEKSQNTLSVAMRENAVIELEDDYTESYRGFDPHSSESYIIFELTNNLHLSQSLDFAALAQRDLVSHANRADKGVRQAGFWVLWATSMPSVLIELDFICNPRQEEFLNSENGRNLCAEAIAKAFKEYYKSQQKALARH